MVVGERPASRGASAIRHAAVALVWGVAVCLSVFSMFALPRYAFHLMNSGGQISGRSQTYDPLLGLGVAIIGMFVVPVLAFVASRAVTYYLLGRESRDEYGRSSG